ncbi:MAG: pyruvate kinase [Woeseiaceae bacterium]|nr:pyruvate kinase [Woeseiaceae bacterium]
MTSVVDIERIDRQLEAIRERALDCERRYADELGRVDPRYRDSARNLLHYIALRQLDIRELQQELASLGLSSLGRAERSVLVTLDAVRAALQHNAFTDDVPRLAFRSPAAVRNKETILGPAAAGRDVGIMVTMPTEAATNAGLVSDMLVAGMNVARINCAHDDAESWEAMVGNIRAASEADGRPCKIVMDLAGPKIRTGPLRAGPRVVRFRPRRDPMGRTIAPRRVRLIPDDVTWQGSKVAILPVPAECVEYAHVGDTIRFRDTRGKKRHFAIVSKDDKGLVAELYKSAYIATGTKLRLCRENEGEKLEYRVGELPEVEQPLLLRPGDTLVLDGDNIAGAPAVEGDDGHIETPAHIACLQSEVFSYVADNDRVSLNDGKISGIVISAEKDRLEIEITKAKPTGSRLRGGRGINFPDSDIDLPGLTEADQQNLSFIARHADAVALSFVKHPKDIVALHAALDRLGAGDIGLIVKVETKKAFKNLPEILLTAMQRYPVAVMIARGDLAVEAGWERLAELQEEVLWVCEAAQVPVVWATQVLERKTKRGLASRAEISDAAMSQRADCVMLNKGPHILAAIRMLDNILRRMQAHQYKKTATLRPLTFGDDRVAV